MNEEKQHDFEEGIYFLEKMSSLCLSVEAETDLFEKHSGEKHLKTVNQIGNVSSLLYRAACCHWGCNGGNHLIEHIIGKAINQAFCAYKLYKLCYYDESLMITRGIGEIANLLSFFNFLPIKISEWANQDEKTRYKNFSPSKIREKLVEGIGFAPIEAERYSKLCSIGTHPNPNEIPNHYTGTKLPILGMILQPVGAYVSVAELGYAIGWVSIVTPNLLGLHDDIKQKMINEGERLLESLGNFNIMSYVKGLEIALKKHDKNLE
ncbi:MAG TPA: hypothetical protein VHA52_12110 [Candidatus Babeliaceae bacterium]|nr:hypothetical protein [Candidatus Babeliaceae bacterium]